MNLSHEPQSDGAGLRPTAASQTAHITEYDGETLAERDARIHAWLTTISPGDVVTVRLNSTDTLTGKVYEAPDVGGTSLCVWTTVLRHGNGYPGGSFEPEERDERLRTAVMALLDECKCTLQYPGFDRAPFTSTAGCLAHGSSGGYYAIRKALAAALEQVYSPGTRGDSE